MSQTQRGLVWVVFSGLVFVTFIIVIRYVGTNLHPIQSAFIRYALSFVVLLPIILKRGSGIFVTRNVGRYAIRGFCHALGVLLWFYAITQIPVAEATALSYLSPVFVLIGAGLFLGEHFSITRLFTVIAGLVGVLIILRPGFIEISTGAIAILFSAPLFALSKLLVKDLLREDESITTVLYLSIFATLTLFWPALWVWTDPSIIDLSLLLLAAVLATLSHYMMARGLKLVDVTVALPAELLMLVWATLFGMYLFDENPSIWAGIGGAVIVFSLWLSSRDQHSQPNIK